MKFESHKYLKKQELAERKADSGLKANKIIEKYFADFTPLQKQGMKKIIRMLK